MITNISEEVEFYCNNHTEPIPLKIMTGNSAFYACPKYMLKDETHPDGHEENERACANRLSFDDAGNILMEFNKLAFEAFKNDEFIDFTNTCFKCKYYDVKVLFYSEDKICFGIVNRRAVQ